MKFPQFKLKKKLTSVFIKSKLTSQPNWWKHGNWVTREWRMGFFKHKKIQKYTWVQPISSLLQSLIVTRIKKATTVKDKKNMTISSVFFFQYYIGSPNVGNYLAVFNLQCSLVMKYICFFSIPLWPSLLLFILT